MAPISEELEETYVNNQKLNSTGATFLCDKQGLSSSRNESPDVIQECVESPSHQQSSSTLGGSQILPQLSDLNEKRKKMKS